MSIKNFNTSYVMVQLLHQKEMPVSVWDFNTSYVMVQLFTKKKCLYLFGISIHLMLWFNNYFNYLIDKKIAFQYILCYGSTLHQKEMPVSVWDFNTSYVMVQQRR